LVRGVKRESGKGREKGCGRVRDRMESVKQPRGCQPVGVGVGVEGGAVVLLVRVEEGGRVVVVVVEVEVGGAVVGAEVDEDEDEVDDALPPGNGAHAFPSPATFLNASFSPPTLTSKVPSALNVLPIGVVTVYSVYSGPAALPFVIAVDVRTSAGTTMPSRSTFSCSSTLGDPCTPFLTAATTVSCLCLWPFVAVARHDWGDW
jgi:hypothetical protein